jgi:hypothetical protein
MKDGKFWILRYAQNDGICKIPETSTNRETSTPLNSNPLLPRLRCSVSWEFSAIGCLSVSEFPIAAHEAE